MTATPLETLLEKLSGGDADAAQEVFLTYEPYLRLVVRRMLPPALRRKFDSVDVVHSIWADLLQGFRDSGWRFEDATHLRAFLVKATRNRFLDQVRRNRRAAAAERPLDVPSLQDQLAERGPRPSEVARSNELWTQMLALCPPEHQPLLKLRRQGFTVEEIAERTGYHPGSVRRIFYNLARDLANQHEPGTSSD